MNNRSIRRKAAAVAAAILTALLCTVPWSGAASVSVSHDETLSARPAIHIDLRSFFGAPASEKDVAPRILIPGGNAVGVAIRTRGVLVVGVDEKNDTGLRTGDIILSANGLPLTQASVLTAAVTAADGQMIELLISRSGSEHTLLVTPHYDEAGAAWRLGAWVRDSTAGVGTLTYYDPSTGKYGALGHAITDADTGSILSVRTGALLQAQIVDVRRGQRGAPGELRGSFLREQMQLGSVDKNTASGIYGTLDVPAQSALYPDGLPIGSRSDAHIGSATILSTVDGGPVTEYAVEITHIAPKRTSAQKAMTLLVTDERLLEITGGIVQGMSGSPIIQDGKIVGAVTHVLVNDPTRGYGIFIEQMLSAAE